MGLFYKRRRRSIALVILASWLFAIFASVANACGVDENLTHSVAGHAAQVGGHDRSGHGASPACDKFCADDLAVLAKVKAVADPPAGEALVAPAVVGQAFPIAAAPVFSAVPATGPLPPLAVNIRFVRLAL